MLRTKAPVGSWSAAKVYTRDDTTHTHTHTHTHETAFYRAVSSELPVGEFSRQKVIFTLRPSHTNSGSGRRRHGLCVSARRCATHLMICSRRSSLFYRHEAHSASLTRTSRLPQLICGECVFVKKTVLSPCSLLVPPFLAQRARCRHHRGKRVRLGVALILFIVSAVAHSFISRCPQVHY
jgi:hypothetical protein